MQAMEPPAMPLIGQRLERLSLELQQMERPLTQEQFHRVLSVFREVEEVEAQVQALVSLARVSGVA